MHLYVTDSGCENSMVAPTLEHRIANAIRLIPEFLNKANSWVKVYKETYEKAHAENKVFVSDIHHLNDQYVGMYFIGIKNLTDFMNFDHMLQDPGFQLVAHDIEVMFPWFDGETFRTFGRTIQDLHYLHAVGMANRYDTQDPQGLAAKFLQLPDPKKVEHLVSYFSKFRINDLLAQLSLNTTIDLNKLLQSTIPPGGKTEWQKGVSVTFHADLDELPKGRYKPITWLYIFRELRNNALDAQQNGGEVRIKTYEDQGKAIITYRDAGKGIDPENQERIFEAGYTTKEAAGKPRQGLGLSVIKSEIERSNGQITVSNYVDQNKSGAEFRISLPIIR